jgi:hypothetical protein
MYPLKTSKTGLYYPYGKKYFLSSCPHISNAKVLGRVWFRKLSKYFWPPYSHISNTKVLGRVRGSIFHMEKKPIRINPYTA